jgi:hypothetical protein
MDEQEIHWHILDVLLQDFGSKLGKLGRFCFTANSKSNPA